MNGAQVERRRTTRHQTSLQLVVRELPRPAIDSIPAVTIQGETRNISSRGICVQLSQPCRESALLHCEILVPGCPAPIPTLAHVRWTQNGKGQYVAGLEFLPNS